MPETRSFVQSQRPEKSTPISDSAEADDELPENRRAELRQKFYESCPAAEDFFTKQNLTDLKNTPPAERLYLLSLASGSLTVTPALAELYYRQFPDDLEAVAERLRECAGLPETGSDHMLFTVSVPEIIARKGGNLASVENYRLESYQDIAARRGLAPKFLMGEEKLRGFSEFGVAADGLRQALAEADELETRGDHFIDPQKMFTPEFEALAPPAQAALLRQTISVIHNALLFHEVFNSELTAQRAARDRQRERERPFRQYNVAHSIIYHTYQPVAVFGYPAEYYQHTMDNTAEGGGYLEEYPYHRLLLAALARLKEIPADNQANCDTVVDLWQKNRNPIFGNAASDTLSAQDPTYAAGRLLPLLRAEPQDKHVFSAILYRLEFGRLGISEEGVRYLERVYDLGEYNDPSLHVRRLTSEGEVGIFDEDLRLIKYFQLGDLSDGQQKVEAKVLDFVYETLFMAPENETAEEREKRLQYLAEFKQHYYKLTQDQMFAETGVSLNNLSFQEQGWFLIYLNRANESERERLRQFVKRHGELGLKTFFSLGSGEELGPALLDIGEWLAPAAAEALFIKYDEIVAIARQVERYLAERFGLAPAEHQEEKRRVTDSLLARGKKLLTRVAEDAHSGKLANEAYLAEQLSALNGIKGDVLLFANTFKIASEKQTVDFNDIRGVVLGHKDSGKLTSQEKAAMKEIFMANRRSNPAAYPPALLKKREKEFADLLQETGKKFYLLRDGETVIAFVHYEDKQDAHGPARYLGSFNVDPNGRGQKIGTAFLQSTLAAEGAGRRVILNVNGNNPYLNTYLTTLGFRVEHVEPNYRESGIPYYFLERSPSSQPSAAPEINQRAA